MANIFWFMLGLLLPTEEYFRDLWVQTISVLSLWSTSLSPRVWTYWFADEKGVWVCVLHRITLTKIHFFLWESSHFWQVRWKWMIESAVWGLALFQMQAIRSKRDFRVLNPQWITISWAINLRHRPWSFRGFPFKWTKSSCLTGKICSSHFASF